MRPYSIDLAFASASSYFDQVRGWFGGEDARKLPHEQLERRASEAGRELTRLLLQDHFDLRAATEARQQSVVGQDGVARRAVEPSARCLHTVVGEVTIPRLAYRARGVSNVHPADEQLNLPAGKHSHGLREMVARTAAMVAFEATGQAVAHATGQSLGKRQIERLTAAASVDFDAFYQQHRGGPSSVDDVLAMTIDGKGIVMRPEDLRPNARRYQTSRRLQMRRTQGEQIGRKRMATVSGIYDIASWVRTPEEIFAGSGAQMSSERPRPRNKHYRVSVEKPVTAMIAELFDNAERRDPLHRRPWVMLVDGDWRYLKPIESEAKRRGAKIQIVLDIVHVVEYLWGAARCFFALGNAAAEKWVRALLTAILNGRSSTVAAAIRRKATACNLSTSARRPVDTCADYLLKHKRFMQYDKALESGYPIGSGVVEGACRHIIADRMDITGARWSLPGAEAVLRLRTLRANNDLDAYWNFHLERERGRIYSRVPA